MKPLGAPARWFTTLAVAAVAAVNAAGLWGIAVARRSVAEQAAGLFEAEVRSRARHLEGALAAIRDDLGFLSESSLPPLGAPAPAPRAGAPQRTETALLLFLRGHAEVRRILVRSADGRPLVHIGRRGRVPVLWLSSSPRGDEGVAVDPGRPRVTTVLAGAGGGTAARRVEAEVDPGVLLGGAVPSGAGDGDACRLQDAAGALLARHPLRPAAGEPGQPLAASAAVPAEGWSAGGPWTLACSRSARSAVALAEPLARRYRTTLVLNTAAMGLAVLLGGLALQQAGRRERLEARAREEGRVRELERQLWHAERLATVGRLAAGIAHEINNPLEGMANYLTLAREALARGDAEAARSRLDRVHEGLERAAGVVRQVLAHADPAKAPHTPLDLNPVFREAVEFVRSRPEFAGIRFALALAPGPLEVRGSRVMLGQVALNLLVNACEAQPLGGEVRVCTRSAGGHVEAEVIDRGPGLPVARDRLFEPFFSTKDSTGLGLAICHAIARQHAGELAAESPEEGGAVFRLRLPAARTA